MRSETSLVLIAVGTILRFAVFVAARGLDVHAVGLILTIVCLPRLVIRVLRP
jgi:hypothetical protein